MYRVYICGPMSGYPKFNFPLFDSTKRSLKLANRGWVVISPADMDRLYDGFNGNGDVPVGLDHSTAMLRDLPTVIMCDAIYLLSGWSKSKGAKAEVATALACGLDILYENGAENIIGVTLVN